MSSSQTRVDMINKDLRDVMNSADKDYIKKKQIDIRKNAKSLLLENFYIGDMHMTKTSMNTDIIQRTRSLRESRCPPLNLTPFDIPESWICQQCGFANTKRVYACRSCGALFSISRGQWLSALCKGCFVNIQDSNERWFVGVILRVEENHVVINYYSWNSSFCERVEKKSARLQPYLTTMLDKSVTTTPTIAVGDEVFVESGIG